MSALLSYYARKSFLWGVPQFRHFLLFSTQTIETPPPEPSFMVDYLIRKCGFSTETAKTASAELHHISSPKKPDSVLNFFETIGLEATQIKDLISWRPKLLASSVEKTLKPKIRVLQDLGLFGSDLGELLVKNPYIFLRSVKCNILPNISFLRSILQSDEDVIKTLRKSRWLLCGRIEKKMLPNVLILQNRGVSEEIIKKFILQNPRYLLHKSSWLLEVMERVEVDFGVSGSSSMYRYAIDTVGSLSRSTMESKIRIFESFGWKKEDIVTGFQILPYILGLSEQKLRKGLEFWMNELGFEPSYIAQRPKILMYNLETKVIPRYVILKALRSNKLLNKNPSLYTVICMTEERFLKYYVVPYKDEAPDEYQAYISCLEAASRSGK